MSHYIVRNTNQTIDLFDKIDTNQELLIVVEGKSLFDYALLSPSQLERVDFSTLIMESTQRFEKIIDVSQRYLIFQAPNPTTISVKITIKPKVAESFQNGYDANLITVSVIAYLCLIIIIVVGLIFLIRYFFRVYSGALTESCPMSSPSQNVYQPENNLFENKRKYNNKIGHAWMYE